MTDCPNCDKLRRLIDQLNLALRKKNRELDALYYVWCKGGCESGVNRWTNAVVTEELVQTAERNTKRLREWFEAHKTKL